MPTNRKVSSLSQQPLRQNNNPQNNGFRRYQQKYQQFQPNRNFQNPYQRIYVVNGKKKPGKRSGKKKLPG